MSEREKLEQLITHPELRFGYVCELYYSLLGRPVPKQLDLLHTWFPGMIITLEESDGSTKITPVYNDTERCIHAVKYHGYIYSGGNNRVTQITGRLIGTSSSNLEKERKTAELIQKNISRRIIKEMDPILDLQENTAEILSKLSEEEIQDFHYLLYIYVLRTADHYNETEEYLRDTELYPYDDEVLEQILYNALYQLLKYDFDGMVNAYLWLLLGSLLRNECGRITRTYDSSFIPLYKAAGESHNFLDKFWYLIAPEDFESVYTGDDLDQRFPGIEWFCDNCHDHLNEQPGFDDHLPEWQCRKCGYVNVLDSSAIYDNEEDYHNDIQRKDDLEEAVQRRKEEVGGHETDIYKKPEDR